MAVVTHWLGSYWPLILLLAVLICLAVCRKWLIDRWDWFLERPWGSWWPVPAAILPSCIPSVGNSDGSSLLSIPRLSVTGLLLAIAVLNIYGQERNNRDRRQTAAERIRERNKTEDRISEQRALSVEQRALLHGLFDQFRKQSAGIRDIADEVSRLADAISALASQAEEEEEV